MQTLTIEMGTIDGKGVVILYQPFKDVLKAILLKWIQHGETGKMAARAMMVGKMKDVMNGQLKYWDHGISFLSQKFASQINDTINLKHQLETLLRWGEDAPIPESWTKYIEMAEANGDVDVPEITTPERGGNVRVKSPRKPAGKGRRRSGKADGGGDAADSRPLQPAGSTADGSRASGDAADHLGGGRSPKTRRKTGQPRSAKRTPAHQAG